MVMPVRGIAGPSGILPVGPVVAFIGIFLFLTLLQTLCLAAIAFHDLADRLAARTCFQPLPVRLLLAFAALLEQVFLLVNSLIETSQEYPVILQISRPQSG